MKKMKGCEYFHKALYLLVRILTQFNSTIASLSILRKNPEV